MIDLLTQEQLEKLNTKCDVIRDQNIGVIINTLITDVNDERGSDIDVKSIIDTVDKECIFYTTRLGQLLSDIVKATNDDTIILSSLDRITLLTLNGKCGTIAGLDLGDKIEAMIQKLNSRRVNEEVE